jgi:hypothetical protein
MAPRGYRNFNPGNIEDGDFARGLPGYAGSDGRFARFATMDDGFGAMDRLLTTQPYQQLGSIEGAISRWAPTSDGNNVNAYVSNVARITGLDPRDPSVLQDPAKRQLVIRAMAQHENGGPPGAMDEAFSSQARAQQPPLQAAMSMQPPQPTTLAERAADFVGDGTLGNKLQQMGAWAQSLDNPQALSLVAQLNKPRPGRYSLVRGENGRMYHIDNHQGGVRLMDEGGPQKIDATILKDANESVQKYSNVAQISDRAAYFKQKIASGELQPGLLNKGRQWLENTFGSASPQTQLYNEFDTFQEQLRNSILLLAKGPQTDSDAARAQNEFLSGLSKFDPATAARALDNVILRNGQAIGAARTGLDTYTRQYPRSDALSPITQRFDEWGAQHEQLLRPTAPSAPTSTGVGTGYKVLKVH